MENDNSKQWEPYNNYPCNAVSGRREGETCSFPFLFPDCKQSKKPTYMCLDPGVTPVLYMNCSTIGKASYLILYYMTNLLSVMSMSMTQVMHIIR